MNSVFVLFGATGDLALKKIFPALEALHSEGFLGEGSFIIGVGRRDWDDAAFLSFLMEKKALANPDFLENIRYSKVDIEAGSGYGDLKRSIDDAMRQSPEAELVIYLSLAPQFHPKVVADIKGEGILSRREGKLLIEKPFGTDERTACELNGLVGRLFSERQVYRVDHYLAKDTLRAIMDIHENTYDFDRLIAAESVASIRMRIFEEKGIDGRGETYESVGAFRDVGQNHLLEMLAVIAADVPKKPSRDGKVWQKARARALELLMPPAKTCELSRRGQYEGYEREKGVRAGSQAETAFEICTTFRSGKLKGTEIILQAGKMMPSSEASIEIEFRDDPDLPKRIIFMIQPEREIRIVDRDGSIELYDAHSTRDAYGNVIRDALLGDRRGFVGANEIKALWAYADRIVACWDKVPLERYSPDPGSGKPFLIK